VHAEHVESYGTDTTIVAPRSPDTLIRVDVTPNATASAPRSAAQPVISAVSQERGYHEIGLSNGILDGFPALRWEFLVPEAGVLLHKVDVFFVDNKNADEVAVLTQAPARRYPGLAAFFTRLRLSVAMN
jgi:hypothetical protein